MRTERGAALLEVLVAVALLGLVLAAISASTLTALSVTRSTSERQREQAAAMNFSETLKAVGYLPCGGATAPTPAAYQARYDADAAAWRPEAGSGITVRVVGVEYLRVGASGSLGDFVASCPGAASGVDHGRQRLALQVTLTGRPPSRASVVVSEPQVTPTPAGP